MGILHDVGYFVGVEEVVQAKSNTLPY